MLRVNRSHGIHLGDSFLDLPIFDEKGAPMHDGCVVQSEPGLYFVGLNFLYSMSSTMIHSVGRDAARIVDTLFRRRSVPEARRGSAVPSVGTQAKVVRAPAMQ